MYRTGDRVTVADVEAAVHQRGERDEFRRSLYALQALFRDAPDLPLPQHLAVVLDPDPRWPEEARFAQVRLVAQILGSELQRLPMGGLSTWVLRGRISVCATAVTDQSQRLESRAEADAAAESAPAGTQDGVVEPTEPAAAAAVAEIVVGADGGGLAVGDDSDPAGPPPLSVLFGGRIAPFPRVGKSS